MKDKKFWQFRNQAGNKVELLLYGDIAQTSWYGDEVTPREFADELAGLGALDEITVRINSGGGDVFAAQAIGNQLEQHPAKVTAQIDGMCASAATIVACHCDKVVSANDGTYMIHPVKMGICDYVDAAQLQQSLNALQVIRENIVNLYVKKTGREKDEVAAQMDATTWFTAADAKDAGFIDELIDEDPTAIENRNGTLFVNSVNMGLAFDKTPESVQNRAEENSAGFANTPPAGQPENSHKEVTDNMAEEIKTVDDLRTAYPALVDQMEKAAAENATKAERQRIQNITEMALPGDEAITNEAMFTKPVSASEYAQNALKRAKAQGRQFLKDAKDDAASAGKVSTDPVDSKTDEFMDALKSVAPKTK